MQSSSHLLVQTVDRPNKEQTGEVGEEIERKSGMGDIEVTEKGR